MAIFLTDCCENLGGVELKSNAVCVCMYTLLLFKHCCDIVSCLWTCAKVPKMLSCVPNK